MNLIHPSVKSYSFSPSVLDYLQNGMLVSDQVLVLLNRYWLIPKLLREVLLDRAISSFSWTPEERSEAYRQSYTQHQVQSDCQLQDWLQHNRTDREQIKTLITRNFQLDKFKRQQSGHQVELYFLKRKRFLDRAIYSLIRLDNPAITWEIYFRLQEGEASFADLAKQYSKGHEVQTCGILGPVEMSQPYSALAALLATHEPGQLIPPIHIENWVMLARVEQFFPAQLDGAMQQRLLHELFEQWLEAQLNEQHS